MFLSTYYLAVHKPITDKKKKTFWFHEMLYKLDKIIQIKCLIFNESLSVTRLHSLVTKLTDNNVKGVNLPLRILNLQYSRHSIIISLGTA